MFKGNKKTEKETTTLISLNNGRELATKKEINKEIPFKTALKNMYNSDTEQQGE